MYVTKPQVFVCIKMESSRHQSVDYDSLPEDYGWIFLFKNILDDDISIHVYVYYIFFKNLNKK